MSLDALVIGAGPIGLLFAGEITLSGGKAGVLDFQGRIDDIKEKELVLKRKNRQDKAVIGYYTHYPTNSLKEDLNKDTLVIIATKTYSLNGVAKDYAPLFAIGSPILLAQNGINQEVRFGKVLRKNGLDNSVARGVIEGLADEIKEENSLVIDYKINSVSIGHWIEERNNTEATARAKELLEGAPFDVHAGDYQEYMNNMFFKAIVNSGANSISTLYGCTLGDIKDNKRLYFFSVEKIMEASWAAARYGFDDKDITRRVYAIYDKGLNHIASMGTDTMRSIINCKPMATEIEDIDLEISRLDADARFNLAFGKLVENFTAVYNRILECYGKRMAQLYAADFLEERRRDVGLEINDKIKGINEDVFTSDAEKDIEKRLEIITKDLKVLKNEYRNQT